MGTLARAGAVFHAGPGFAASARLKVSLNGLQLRGTGVHGGGVLLVMVVDGGVDGDNEVLESGVVTVVNA